MRGPRHGEGPVPSPSITVTNYREHRSGALQGFATTETPSGFTIHGVAIFDQAGSRWCGLPNRPRLSSGKAVKAKGGGWVTDPVLEIRDPRRKEVFGAAVLMAFDRYQKELEL